MVKRLAFTAFLLLAALTLSAQQMYMQVQVLQPAEVKLPADVRNLLLINSTTLSGEEPLRCLFAASNALSMTDRFDEVAVLPEVKTNASVDSLCERYESDALLSLNAIVFAGLTANAYWTVYYPGGRSYSFFTDTDLTEAEDVFSYVGEQMAFILAPYWQDEDRYLYSNDNPAILAGLKKVQTREWEAAIEAWKQVATNDKLTTAYACANIAVAYEMLDRYAEAESWTDRAISSFSRINTPDAAQQVVNLRYYKTQLHTRAGN
jgi:tetratricopeptide (TPR) repeat protein